MRIGVKPGQYGWNWGELRDAWRAAEQVPLEVTSLTGYIAT